MSDLLTSKRASQIFAEDATVNPEKKTVDILIVVDMQKDFLSGPLGRPEATAIIPGIVAKIEEYKAKGGVVIALRDTHEENYMDTQEAKYLPVVHAIEGTGGWQLDDAITAALPEDAILINKYTFGSLDLVKKIGEYVAKYGQQYVNVEIVGILTDICVINNTLLLKAFFYEMPVSLDASCCAAVTPESHKAALLTMTMSQVNILNQ